MSFRPARWDPGGSASDIVQPESTIRFPAGGRVTFMPFTHGFSTSALLRPLGFAGRRSHSRVRSPGTSKGPPFRSATNARSMSVRQMARATSRSAATRALAGSRCARVRSSPADCASFRPRRARPGDLRAFQQGRDGGLLRFPIDQQRANHHRLEQQHDLVAVRVVRLESGAPGTRPRSNSVPRIDGSISDQSRYDSATPSQCRASPAAASCCRRTPSPEPVEQAPEAPPGPARLQAHRRHPCGPAEHPHRVLVLVVAVQLAVESCRYLPRLFFAT